MKNIKEFSELELKGMLYELLAQTQMVQAELKSRAQTKTSGDVGGTAPIAEEKK